MKNQIIAPFQNGHEKTRLTKARGIQIICAVTLSVIWIFLSYSWDKLRLRKEPADFFYNTTQVKGLCDGPTGNASSWAGHIGLRGDSDSSPKRSFFWLFEAENDPENAPVILTIGGGPGSSGMMGPTFGSGPCVMTSSGLMPNENRWTENFNLLALDQPIGVGYSYGKMSNTSYDAAIDVYDFLQKFFKIYPHLAKNQFVLSGASYGGVYIPNIATRIHHEKSLLAIVDQQRTCISTLNPWFSDPIAHFQWMLHYRCEIKSVYNTTSCQEGYSKLPQCLENLEFLVDQPSMAETLGVTLDPCYDIAILDAHDTVLEDVRRKCHEDPEDSLNCLPEYGWATHVFNTVQVKTALGLPRDLRFEALNKGVHSAFDAAHDREHRHYLLYEPLLNDGIRLLHYVGTEDANCAWPGVVSFLKSIRSPFQTNFIQNPDLPWVNHNASVRVVGEGSGAMALILVNGAGHFDLETVLKPDFVSKPSCRAAGVIGELENPDLGLARSRETSPDSKMY